MANRQNICREWGEIPPRNSVWEGFFRGQGPCLCVEDLLLPPSLWRIYQGTNKPALENFVGTMQEVTTRGCTPDPLPDSCRHLWYSHIFSLLILLSGQQPLWSVPPHYGDWRSFPAVRWDSHVIRALQTTLIGLPIRLQQIWTQLLGETSSEVVTVRRQINAMNHTSLWWHQKGRILGNITTSCSRWRNVPCLEYHPVVFWVLLQWGLWGLGDSCGRILVCGRSRGRVPETRGAPIDSSVLSTGIPFLLSESQS